MGEAGLAAGPGVAGQQGRDWYGWEVLGAAAGKKGRSRPGRRWPPHAGLGSGGDVCHAHLSQEGVPTRELGMSPVEPRQLREMFGI